MRQLRERFGLDLDPRPVHLVLAAQHLDRDVSLEALVDPEVDRAHRPGAEALLDAVPAQPDRGPLPPEELRLHLLAAEPVVERLDVAIASGLLRELLLRGTLGVRVDGRQYGLAHRERQ